MGETGTTQLVTCRLIFIWISCDTNFFGSNLFLKMYFYIGFESYPDIKYFGFKSKSWFQKWALRNFSLHFWDEKSRLKVASSWNGQKRMYHAIWVFRTIFLIYEYNRKNKWCKTPESLTIENAKSVHISTRFSPLTN